MTLPVTTATHNHLLQGTQASLQQTLEALGQAAKAASKSLATKSDSQKNQALQAIAAAIRNETAQILSANQQDVEDAKNNKTSSALIDRLSLTPARIAAIASSVETIATIPDPIGAVLSSWERPNGLKIERVRVPLGVIGVIYESRPNVTADAAALCLKAGNAVILRGGSDSLRTSLAIHTAIVKGLIATGFPEATVSLIPVRNREAVGFMLSGLNKTIDVIVPRGGKSLVARVESEARVPVFAHLEGICHVYVHEKADLEKTRAVVLNAKMRRTGICGAAETLLLDKAIADKIGTVLLNDLISAGCEIRGDKPTQALDKRVKAATEEDWHTEYLDAILSVRVVENMQQAIEHIETYGSHHTDAIMTEDTASAEKFMNEVDSAIVIHNASTQFADGGEFGFGAEIGIATGRFHARGPVGAEQLTTFKYRVHGNGQTRPV